MKASFSNLKKLELESMEFRDIYQRASKQRLTVRDRSKLSNCPTSCRTYIQAAKWLLDDQLKKIKSCKESLISSGQMFDFPSECAIAPSIMLRSSLFQPMPRGGRRWRNKEVVASWGGVELIYTGITLSQSDFDVLLCFTRLLRDAQVSGKTEKISTEAGETVYHRLIYSEYALLKQLKRSGNDTTYEWLKSTLSRLKGHLTFITSDIELSFPILGESARVSKGVSYVDINEKFIRTLGLDNFSLINMNERLAIKNDTTKWLHGFIASHKGGSTISAERLMREMKSNTKRTRDFIRRRLKPSLKELSELSVIQDFTVKGHLISWVR